MSEVGYWNSKEQCDIADALEAKDAEIGDLQALWKLAHDGCSEAMLDLLKYKALCKQLGRALESHHSMTRQTYETHVALTAWRNSK